MAVEYINVQGRMIAAIANREVRWHNNSPTNEEHWNYFKHVIEKARFEQITFQFQFIEETFNPIYDLHTGFQLQSSIDRLFIHLEENNFRCLVNEVDRNVVVQRKPFN